MHRARRVLALCWVLLPACPAAVEAPSDAGCQCDAGARPEDATQERPDSAAADAGRIVDAGVPDRDARRDAVESDLVSADDRAAPPDVVGTDSGPVDDAGTASHRTSLARCWLDPTCHRALVVAHGGDWNVSDAPFGSRAAFARAHELGVDGIETDVRVTLDGVPVLAHSSPIEYYESLGCGGQRIEEMTAAEVTTCVLVPASADQRIQRLDDTLAWASGKLILELDVKEARDLARVIAVILEEDATDRAFVMVSTGEIAIEVPAAPGWEQVHYMVNIGSAALVADQAASATARHVFLFEMERSYPGEADESQVTALLRDVVNPAGVKGFTSSDKNLATVANHRQVFAQGFDVVLSYDPANGVAAAQLENAARGYLP